MVYQSMRILNTVHASVYITPGNKLFPYLISWQQGLQVCLFLNFQKKTRPMPFVFNISLVVRVRIFTVF